MQFLVTRGRVLNCYYDGLKLFFRFFELLARLNDLLDRSDLLPWLSRFVECREQLICVRYAFSADLDWVALFCRDGKGAARFERSSG